MNSIILEPTETAQWQSLVVEAEKTCHLELSDDLESYLVFLLARFARQPEMAASVLATEFLYGVHAVGSSQQYQLRDVGDKCLLFSGLFPGRAQKRHVRISYFVKLGKSAYGVLSEINKQHLAELYASLSSSFVPLMDVLQAMHQLTDGQTDLLPLEAAELWQDTGSQRALAVLRSYTNGTLVIDSDKK